MYLLVLKQLTIMLVIGIGGFIFAKIFKCGDTEQKFLSKLLLYFINPCMVINSFNKPFDSAKLKLLGLVILISFFIHGIMIAIAFLTTLSKNPAHRDFNLIDRVALVFTNCGFVGIPLINGVFGSEGVFYLMGYLVVFNLLLWTFGYAQFGGSVKILKIITNPNIVAICLGLILFCLPVDIPEAVLKPIYMIGELNTATAMILIGILFASFKLPEKAPAAETEGSVPVVSRKYFIFRVIKACFIRLVFISIINLAITIVLYQLLSLIPGMDLEVLKIFMFVIYICSMCPCGTSIPSLACVFDRDTSYASLLIPLTSIGCIVTIPAFVALAELIIH
ncbi:MAG: AEC family transporter [Treponema sp.]|nr:AEC family transporter [Treponema sp.]